MKKILPLIVLALAGCGAADNLAMTVGTVVTVGSVAAIQRTPLDALYSVITGRDCSVVRLDRGETYCRAVEPAPEPPPFCTRNLGTVTCWADPAAMPGQLTGVADGPAGLTAPQEADRVRRWP